MRKEHSSKYECDKCRDLTFIIIDNEARPCECRALREAKRIIKNSGVSKEFRSKTFENFDYCRDHKLMEAYKVARNYVSDFDEIEDSRNNSIMFMGQVGSGKTHLSLAICNSLMDRGIGVVYMGYREFIINIKQNMIDPAYYNKEMNRVKRCRVLLIDDLFKGSITGSDVNIIFELINYRYFNNLPIVLSCELVIDDIMKIDEAIGSRIFEMCKDFSVELKGKKLNYRILG